MKNGNVSSQLMVLMFTDLVGSTRLKRELGPDSYRELALKHDQAIRRAIASAPSGRILQDTGDGFFIGFGNISDAVNAALSFQWQMAHENWPQPFSARVGLHLGQVEKLESEATGKPKYLATAADIAARVMSLAEGGQILLTRSVFDEARQFVRSHPAVAELREPPSLRWLAHGPYQIKGSEEPVDVFEVGADGVAAFKSPPNSDKATRYIRPGDEATLGWRPAAGLALPNAPHWIITEKLGEGGFGEVWLALHNKAKTLRVFKFCFDPERLRALKREVVLFRLLKEELGDRRDIAPVRDWSIDKPPYFIEMEYTPGGNLADWIESLGGMANLSAEQRIDVVARLARALAAAHSVGVLHKDIKPSNVLMVKDDSGHWHPRLTDFGIGILTDRSRLAEHNITADGFTASGLALNDSSRTGTRMYAPPESLSGKAHSVQGDIYALGVMLYQLIVGDLNRPLASGWERDVSDRLLLEDITSCVDRDPTRRFSSAGELAQRLETLSARRSELAAREASALAAQRRLRRKRILRSGMVVAGVLLVLVATAGIYHIHNLHVEQARTAQALEKFSSVQAFLTDEVLANATPEKIHDAKVLEEIVTKLINPAAQNIDRRFAGKPTIEALVRHVMAVNLRKAGYAKDALPHIQKAFDIRKKELGPDDPDTLASQDYLGQVLESVGQPKEAEPIYREVLERRTKTLGPKHRDTLTTLNNLAMVLKWLGHADQAKPIEKEALDKRTDALGSDDPDTLMSLNNYALILQALHEPKDAEPLHKTAMDRRKLVLGEDHPDTLASMHNFAIVINSLGRTQEAEALLKDVWERRKRVLGPNHHNTLLSLTAYAFVLKQQSRNEAAVPLFKEAMDRNRLVNGPDHAATLNSINGYALALDDVGRAKEAEPYITDALDRASRNPNMGIAHPDTKQIALNCAKTLDLLNRHPEAVVILKKYNVFYGQ